MTQQMSDMLQLVVVRNITQLNRNDSKSVRYASACLTRASSLNVTGIRQLKAANYLFWVRRQAEAYRTFVESFLLG
jgi:hypothetical protein